MQSTAGLYGLRKTSVALAGVALLAGLAGCGGLAPAPDGGYSGDAPLPPVWPAEVTMASCERYASAPVGNYVVSSNYWNQEVCPGEQCIEINTATGAFSVTQVADPCGNKVSSFPNILYGCAYGTCSPGATLPMQVSSVKNLKASWDYSIGGGRGDWWNSSIEMWFCPDKECGASGFPNGFEVMLWLDVKNAPGYKDHLGTVNLSGYTWDVWYLASMAAGGATVGWGYMDYIAKPANITSVKDLDILAVVKDVLSRGYVKENWYLYAVQAGFEVRTGGVPYTSNSFSLTVNDVTGSTSALPYTGPSCDGGVPVAQAGQLNVAGTYVTAGPLHGYGGTWAWMGPTSKGAVCVNPVCTGRPERSEAVTCATPLQPNALCIAGTIMADTTYESVAGVGFAPNQDVSATADVDGGIDGGITPSTITIPKSITIGVEKSGENMAGNYSLRAQLTAPDGVTYCYGGSLVDPVPIGQFNTKCWNNSGDFATPTTPITKIDVIVPSAAASDQSFSYCITNVVVQ